MQRSAKTPENSNQLPEKIHVQSQSEVNIPYYGTCRYVTDFLARLDKETNTYRSSEAANEWIPVSSSDYGCPQAYYKNATTPTSVLERNHDSFPLTLDLWAPTGTVRNKTINIKTAGNHTLDQDIKGQAKVNAPVIGEIEINATTKISDATADHKRYGSK